LVCRRTCAYWLVGFPRAWLSGLGSFGVSPVVSRCGFLGVTCPLAGWGFKLCRSGFLCGGVACGFDDAKMGEGGERKQLGKLAEFPLGGILKCLNNIFMRLGCNVMLLK
jgi:hypothetical protein